MNISRLRRFIYCPFIRSWNSSSTMLATAQIFMFALHPKIRFSFNMLHRLRLICPTVTGLWWLTDEHKKEPFSLMPGSAQSYRSTLQTLKVIGRFLGLKNNKNSFEMIRLIVVL